MALTLKQVKAELTQLRTKGAMYETWNANGRVIVSIPDGVLARHYSGAWYSVPVSEKCDALVDLDMLIEVPAL